MQSHRGGLGQLDISTRLLGRIQSLGRGEEATLFMVLVAAFQVLLSKYAGTADVVIGTPVAGRDHSEVEELIGFFVNTVVLRTDLSGDPTFREVLRRVRETTLDAYEHQEVPFERVVEELQPERSLSHSPLFQAMFTLDTAGSSGGLPGLEAHREGADVATTKFDLMLGIEIGAGFRASFEYSTDLFDAGTIDRMLRHFERVLRQAVLDPDLPLSRLELPTEDERQQLVDEWNRTDAAYPADASIPALFEAQAAATPDAVAAVFGDEQLTYRELNERANRLAHRLIALGVRHESRVGVCLERGMEMLVSILAVLKAGGAYVPLDANYPAERLHFMLGDAGVAVLLTQETLRPALPIPQDVRVVSVDGDGDEIASAENPAGAAGPDSLAYVIYTSGSTGTPRGVAVEHRAVVRLVRGANYAELGPEQVILQAAPISFDASTLEIWGALLNGGRVALMQGNPASVIDLGRELVKHGVTTLWLTAGLFQVMVEERLDDLAGVRQLLAGGDVLPVDGVRKVRERFPHIRLINGYGPTENATFTCCHTVTDHWDGGPVPIGTPISSTRVYVLDRALRPVPIGVPGELH
ncbi:MAG TPA: AMP-binding protein, partial [Longimicrobiaceae bacterium]